MQIRLKFGKKSLVNPKLTDILMKTTRIATQLQLCEFDNFMLAMISYGKTNDDWSQELSQFKTRNEKNLLIKVGSNVIRVANKGCTINGYQTHSWMLPRNF